MFKILDYFLLYSSEKRLGLDSRFISKFRRSQRRNMHGTGDRYETQIVKDDITYHSHILVYNNICKNYIGNVWLIIGLFIFLCFLTNIQNGCRARVPVVSLCTPFYIIYIFVLSVCMLPFSVGTAGPNRIKDLD